MSGAELPSMVDVLRAFLDDSPCLYDHNDFCQQHSLHERPCPHETGRQIVAEHAAVQAARLPQHLIDMTRDMERAAGVPQGISLLGLTAEAYMSGWRAAMDQANPPEPKDGTP